ncbi:MAG: VOC family protein [Gammaproteobacteria bacterium]|nr:VOC family protein [Gammaproteobacteria bacterium]
MKPQYFDLSVKDVAAARGFFEAVFGWKFERFPMPYEYYRITAGSLDEPGINGGIGAINDTPICGGRSLVNLTMSVSNLDERIAKIKAAGGAVIEPRTAIPGIGWYATCAEPGGLMFGIIEADPAAG